MIKQNDRNDVFSLRIKRQEYETHLHKLKNAQPTHHTQQRSKSYSLYSSPNNQLKNKIANDNLHLIRHIKEILERRIGLIKPNIQPRVKKCIVNQSIITKDIEPYVQRKQQLSDYERHDKLAQQLSRFVRDGNQIKLKTEARLEKYERIRTKIQNDCTLAKLSLHYVKSNDITMTE